MRVLIVTTYGFDPAFPSRPEQLQARALLRRGHAVVAHEYLDRRYPGQSRRHEWLPGGLPVHRSATLGFFAPEALLRLLLAERPDVIHLHHLRSLLGYQTVLAARRLGIPTVLTVHGLLHDGDLVADRERPLEAPLRFDNLLLTPRRLLARLARGAHPRRAVRNYLIHAPLLHVDQLIALSHHERDLLAQLGADPARISVLPNVVDLSAYAEVSGDGEGWGQKTPVRAQQPRAHNTENHLHSLPHLIHRLSPPTSHLPSPTILFIGQLVPRKGFDLVARAMPAVLAEFPAARFVFVSHNRAGEAELRRIVEAAGVAHALDLRGRVSEDEKIALLRMAAVVTAPSRYEGFGIPLIEAQAAGAPLITCDAPAGNELVEHERTGLLTPYGDATALAAGIVRLLRDRELATRMATTARAEVFARYSADRLADRLEQLYGRLYNGAAQTKRRI